MKSGLYLIAEIGVNYYDTAKELGISLMDAAKLYIREAHNSGANAAKFQTYKASKIASKNSPSYWDRNKEPCNSQFSLFSKFDKFGEAEYSELSDYCKTIGIDFISTPFDFDSSDYLDRLVSVFKISSSDLNNDPFLVHIARFNKPIYLSTGASTENEIRHAVDILKSNGSPSVVLFHCVLSYPTKNVNANLLRIKSLKQAFPECGIGYSDHTVPDRELTCLTTAYLLGATIIEKHFTLNKKLTGNDHYHAFDPKDIVEFRKRIHLIDLLMGHGDIHYSNCEAISRKEARRSLVSTHDIKKGHVMLQGDIALKRPGTGIPPKYIASIVGKTALKDIESDEVLQFSSFSGEKNNK